MPSVGDIIEVKDFQKLTNVAGDILNVYHFKVTAIAGAPTINAMSAEFETWWYTHFLTPILAMQCVYCQHDHIEVNNLMHYATEFGVFSPASPIFGTVSDEYNAPSTAWSFELARLYRTTRNGSKRLPGVPETFVANNQPVGPATTRYGAVETMMSAGQFVGTTTPRIDMVPVIIRKPALVGTPPTVINDVVSAIFRGVGSQTSRKQLL